MTVQEIKLRFGIIGNSPLLDRAIEVARQVAPTDISVFIHGESGSGKEVFPQIIHNLSARKHGAYIAVNCGAIPEGTIDSELFGHEKGSFTGAHEARKGYFEVANGGTIFLDEVAELPMQTQARLLRVLESGEFIKVGSSKVLKTDVRIVAATNVNVPDAISKGKFREDLYYRLSTVPIQVPSLRERIDDIHLLFRKFAADFAAKYRMPVVKLTDGAQKKLEQYRWPGNVRQLKNIAEQISVIEQKREIDENLLSRYIPADNSSNFPMVINHENKEEISERDLLYKVLFEMKRDITDLKKLVLGLIDTENEHHVQSNDQIIKRLYGELPGVSSSDSHKVTILPSSEKNNHIEDHEEVTEESLSLEDREIELIKKAIDKHKGKRKNAANELGISERTLYRKIKEYNIKA